MPSTCLKYLAAAFALSVTAACTATQPAGTAETIGAAEGEEICNAAAAGTLLGLKAEEENVERARHSAGAKTVRVLAPGTAATMDFNPARLNVVTDDAGTVTELRCG